MSSENIDIEDTWKSISLEDAQRLIDMTSGQTGEQWIEIAKEQLVGATDLYKRLGRQRLAWLCDEVGLGKTYVAMAVAALVRRQHPQARILYLLPSSRLLPKWNRELSQFSRRNIREIDNRLRTLQNIPSRPMVSINSLHELALETTLEPDRDFLCTLGSFSFPLAESREKWKQQWENLIKLLPPDRAKQYEWSIVEKRLNELEVNNPNLDKKIALKVSVAEIINTIIPDFDLIICDESHNLRHGLKSGSSRNRLLSVVLGGTYCKTDIEKNRIFGNKTDLRRRARRILMLTATPFRMEYAEISRQAGIFGFVPTPKKNTSDFMNTVEELQSLNLKNNKKQMEDKEIVEKRTTLVQKYIIRRLGTIKVNGEPKSRNQYRLELREGGMNRSRPEESLSKPSIRERLLLAVVQKRVLDVLQPKDSSAGWRFQMGLLSSFESFGQTLETKNNQKKISNYEGENTEEGLSIAQREIRALDSLISSYQNTFNERMPHPKLEQVAEQIAKEAWMNGEKILVFVRRVRTTEELANRITYHFDNYLNNWIGTQLPKELREDWKKVFSAFECYRERMRLPQLNGKQDSARSLFGWYFRCQSKTLREVPSIKGVGGAFGKFFLEAKHPWVVLLEDNPIMVLFNHNEDKLRRWATVRKEELDRRARTYAFINQLNGSDVTKRAKGEAAWFRAFQAAALDILSEEDKDSSRCKLAKKLRKIRFPTSGNTQKYDYYGEPADWLVLPTILSTLQKESEHQELYNALSLGPLLSEIERTHTGDDSERKIMQEVIERDQKQAVFARLLRGSRSYLDLWIAFSTVQKSIDKEVISTIGLEKKSQLSFVKDILTNITDVFLLRLEQGRKDSLIFSSVDSSRQFLSSFLEIARTNRHFQLLRTLNFPKISDESSARGRDLLRNTLSGLEPVIALHGKSKTERAMEQFRMPGFPMVMVATSVVQEGVDLHTFCRKVVHYGIDGSATGTEQRNGRVDRRGSMIARLLEQKGQKQREETIDVYFPHLRQSLEPLQMATLYQRMNRFLLMANKIEAETVSKSQEALCSLKAQLDVPKPYPKPYDKFLHTAFEAKQPSPEECTELNSYTTFLSFPEVKIEGEYGDITIDELVEEGADFRWRTTAKLQNRIQPLTIKLDSGIDSNQATLIVESPVWPFDVIQQNSKELESIKTQAVFALTLQEWNRPTGIHLVSQQRSKNKINLLLRSEIPVDRNTTQESMRSWVCYVATKADELEQSISSRLNELLDLKDDAEIKDHKPEEF